MEQIEFKVASGCDLSGAADVIEQACGEFGLSAGMKASLAAYPGSVHWHYKNGKEKGTLELTLFVRERRIWANVHTNRRGAWIEAMLPKLRRRIEGGLKG